jgi:hypothetical protein
VPVFFAQLVEMGRDDIVEHIVRAHVDAAAGAEHFAGLIVSAHAAVKGNEVSTDEHDAPSILEYVSSLDTWLEPDQMAQEIVEAFPKAEATAEAA